MKIPGFIGSGSGPLNGSDEDDEGVSEGWTWPKIDWSAAAAAIDKDDPPIISPANNLEPVPDVVPAEPVNGMIARWQKVRPLGSGSAGAVYEAITVDGFSFAVKESHLSNREGRLQLEREISVLTRLKHKNIVQYLGTEKDNEKLYIFLELMLGGSLSSLYDKRRLTESEVSAFTSQILKAVEYLHNEMVIHRDIKCSNILVGASGSVKLADFGVAKAIEMNSAKTSTGSPYWMAPEVVNPSSQLNGSYGLNADIWSLGCTVLEMLTRKHPYPELEPIQASYRIGKGEPPQVPDYLSREARDLILRCLKVNPDERPSVAQLLRHPFARN